MDLRTYEHDWFKRIVKYWKGYIRMSKGNCPECNHKGLNLYKWDGIKYIPSNPFDLCEVCREEDNNLTHAYWCNVFRQAGRWKTFKYLNKFPFPNRSGKGLQFRQAMKSRYILFGIKD